MKRLLYFLTMGVFVLLAQNASAQMPPPTAPPGTPPMAGLNVDECKQIKPRGDYALMKEKKNCMRDLARSLMAGPGVAPGTNP